MLKRISWRIQPIEQIKKRKQRKRDMWERHEKFAEYVERVRKSGGLTMKAKDKIRSMTDEQLADWLADIIDCWHCPTYQPCTGVKGCANALKAWLQQEAESND